MAYVSGRERRANHNRGQHYLEGLPVANFLNNFKNNLQFCQEVVSPRGERGPAVIEMTVY